MKRTLRELGFALAGLLLCFAPATRVSVAAKLGIQQRRDVPAQLAVVPALVAFVAALLVVFLTWSGWLYPLRPDAIGAIGHPFTADRAFDNAWGGPTLIGAWFVHAMAALGMQVVCLAVIRRLNGYHSRVPAEAM